MGADIGPDRTCLKHSECAGEALTKLLASLFESDVHRADDSGEGLDDGSVAGVVSLIGDVEWSLWLGLPRETAVAIASAFAEDEIEFDSEEMGDAVGELTNMLAGDLKARLSRVDLQTTISLPSVVSGERLRVMTTRDTPRERMRFSSSFGPLWVEVAAGVREGETRAAGS